MQGGKKQNKITKTPQGQLRALRGPVLRDFQDLTRESLNNLVQIQWWPTFDSLNQVTSSGLLQTV